MTSFALCVGLLLLVFLLVTVVMAAPAVTSVYAANLTMQVTPSVFGGTGTVTLAPMNTSQTLTGSTTPAVSACSSFSQALTSGSATIDLTSLPGLESTDTVTFNGLKVQHIKLQNPSTNANKISVSNGASNGWRLDGATTSWTITLAPGQEVLINCANSSDTVGSSHKTIDLAGTGAQVLYVEMSAG